MPQSERDTRSCLNHREANAYAHTHIDRHTNRNTHTDTSWRPYAKPHLDPSLTVEAKVQLIAAPSVRVCARQVMRRGVRGAHARPRTHANGTCHARHKAAAKDEEWRIYQHAVPLDMGCYRTNTRRRLETHTFPFSLTN